MPVLKNIATLYQCLADGAQGEAHPIHDAALVWVDGTIRWVGPYSDVPEEYASMERVDADNHIVIPGLVDSHTHLCFGGWRADEFEMRCRGVKYLEIAEAGGGIASTVRATREATEDELLDKSHGFLDEMARLGITTVEAKSGYGLTLEDELKQLRVARELDERHPVRILSTCLGAHIIPPEFRDNRSGYIDLLTNELIPSVADANLATFFDIFVEEGAYTIAEARQLAAVASDAGLAIKLHVDQLSDGGGGKLAAELQATSADHLEYTSKEGIQAMAEAGTIAGALPLATLFLSEQPMNARSFVEAGVPIAVATDFNPGSAPSFHLPLAMMLSCTMCGLTPTEALKGATINGARSLLMNDSVGSLETGKKADFALVDAPSVNHWLYHFRPNDVTATYIDGQKI